MSQFKYAAKSPEGKTVNGVIDAASEPEAVEALRRQNLVVIKLNKARGSWGGSGGGKGGRSKAKKASCKKGELVVFTRQLATMVGAGLSLLESLEVLGFQADSEGMRSA